MTLFSTPITDQTMNSKYREFLATAEDAVRLAGRYAQAQRHRRQETVQTFAHDVKLALDLECQQIAERYINIRHPEHAILGEEGSTDRDSEYCWIIDPIDGTVNFSHGLPYWCCSIALRYRDQVIAAAVFVPMLEELYSATIDGPATCNGSPIHVSDAQRAADCMIATSVPYRIDAEPDLLERFGRISLSVQKTRVMGAAAVDICHVACGRVDAYLERSIYIWDIAAAGLIVERAGGKTEVLRQCSDIQLEFFCSNGIVHDEMLGIIQTAQE